MAITMTPAEIREASIEAGTSLRRMVEQLPDSAAKREFLRISDQLRDFWLTASDEFCIQWLQIAIIEAQS